MIDGMLADLVQALGVTRPAAIILTGLIIGCLFTMAMVTKIMVRQNMHSSHFDVNDKNIDRANQLALESIRNANVANRDAAFARGYLMGRNKAEELYFGKDIEAEISRSLQKRGFTVYQDNDDDKGAA